MVPDTPAAVDSTWLTRVLETPVRNCHLVDSHAGTTGRAVIELEYEQEVTDFPTRMFVKLPPNDEMQRLFVTSSGMGRREAMFYQQLSAEVPVRVPKCFYAETDESGENYIMLLEHLEDSGCTFENTNQHYSLEYVRSVLSEFAKLHAAYWQSQRFAGNLAWVEPPLQHDIAVQLIGVALEQHRAEMPDVFTAMAELYLGQTDAIHRLWEQGPQTLIHGDVHDGNLFMQGPRPGFLDWALLARGPAMRDVGYFLAGTLKASDYDAFPDLLGHYRERLQYNGVEPPSLDELMDQQRWHAAYVWVGAAVTLAMGDAWQPVDYVMSSLGKLHTAMQYLNSVDAIEAEMNKG